MTVEEKMLARGVEVLSDVELLSLLLDDMQSCDQVSQRVMEHFGNLLGALAKEDVSRLRMVEGIGLKRAKRLVAACELGRRCAVSQANEQIVICRSSDIVRLFKPRMESLKHEECWVLYLNSANRIIEQQRISQGGITSTVVDHRLIIKRALELLSTQIVIIHNHPSGDIEPSQADIELTKKIKSAAALFDIKVLDHLILSSTDEFSFLSAGLL